MNKVPGKKLVVLSAALVLAGCATPEVVGVRQKGDSEMNCKQLADANADAQEFERKARAERGVTGKNVAAALLFWPAMIGTYSNTEEAINAAKDRQRHLQKLADDKGCKI